MAPAGFFIKSQIYYCILFFLNLYEVEDCDFDILKATI